MEIQQLPRQYFIDRLFRGFYTYTFEKNVLTIEKGRAIFFTEHGRHYFDSTLPHNITKVLMCLCDGRMNVQLIKSKGQLEERIEYIETVIYELQQMLRGE